MIIRAALTVPETIGLIPVASTQQLIRLNYNTGYLMAGAVQFKKTLKRPVFTFDG